MMVSPVPEVAVASGESRMDSGVKSTKTTVPFLKNNEFDYSSLTPWWDESYTWIIYTLIVVLIVTAVSNGANITDGIDGYLARKRGQITTIGMLLDPLADKLLIAAAFVTLVQFNPSLVPAWMDRERNRSSGETRARYCRRLKTQAKTVQMPEPHWFASCG